MRIGILGGTLDPVHNGHIEIALAIKRELCLDDVMLLPAGNPPHKLHPTDRLDRWNMARLAAKSAGILASDAEIFRDGTTYTVDTMHAFHARQPDVSWVYIIGADTLHVLDSWRNFPEVARLTEFAAVRRPGCDGSQDAEQAASLHRLYGAKIRLMHIAGPDISSTQLRELAAKGRSLKRYVPASVADYIDQNGLYLTTMPLSEARRMVETSMSPHRWQHTIGVSETARRLALLHGLHPAKAYLAGLLHDVAKPLAYPRLREIVENDVPDLDEAELRSEAVLHAPASAVLAYRNFGVRDAQILSAIRKHTLGDWVLTDFEALIYVSDFIEPGRKPFPGLEEARAAARQNLQQAAQICARRTVEYLRTQGQDPHPRTLEMLSQHPA